MVWGQVVQLTRQMPSPIYRGGGVEASSGIIQTL